MTKKPTKKILIISAVFSAALLAAFTVNYSHAQSRLSDRVRGRILLQVEQNGEAWYVNPADQKRHFLGRPQDAFNVMRETGIGITDKNLNKIPVADANVSGADTDGDGLSDVFEDAIGTDKNKADTDGDGYGDKEEITGGYNPNGAGKMPIDDDFADSQAGKVFIQVENNGEAWYVNPADGKRYFLGKPTDAFNVMRGVGLGITDKDIAEVEDAYIKSRMCGNGSCDAKESADSSLCPADCAAVPYSYYSVHCEEDDNLEASYPYLKKLVALADSYNTPLTIMFNPSWVYYILNDQAKIDEIHSWQANGHEIALHHHGPTHGGWNGYSNMPKEEAEALHLKWSPSSKKTYKGTVDEYFVKLKELAAPYEVKSGTVTDKWTDIPEGLVYDADGRTDGRTSKVIKNNYNGKTAYRISTRAGYLEQASRMTEYSSLAPNEIYGAGGHVFDYMKNPEVAENWFKFLSEKDPQGIKRKTVAGIMENYVLPNKLIINPFCGNTVCDGYEKDNNSCSRDCGACDLGSPLYCACGETYRGCEFGDSTQIYNMGNSNEQEAPMGFMGCSVTHNAIDGYQTAGGDNFWVVEKGDGNFGGGGLTDWYDSLVGNPTEKDLWLILENLLKKYPDTKKIWWELCARAEVADMKYEQVLMVLHEIKKMAPGIEIYATPMPIFLDTKSGKCVDNNGPAVIKGFVDKMVGENKVKAGPIISSLARAQTTTDGCHANDAGKSIWGQDLTNFFGE